MRNYIFLGIATVLLGFNIYQLDLDNLFSEDGKVAVIGVLGCLVAIVLLLILHSSNKIKNKLEDKDYRVCNYEKLLVQPFFKNSIPEESLYSL